MTNPRNGHAIVLIQPHCSFELRGEPVLRNEFDSIGLLALGSYLRAQGYLAETFHFARALAQGYGAAELLDRIAELDPLLFGVSINWLHLSQGAIETAGLLKRRFPDRPVVVGGQHATFFAADIMTGHADVFDGVVVGEGEETLLEIADRVREGADLAGIPGLMTARDGGLSFTPRQVTLKLDSLPFISYEHVFPPPRAGGPDRLTAALDTTRGGCRKDCNYCLESRKLGTFGRERSCHYSIGRLVEQIEFYVRQGRDWVTVQDQFFTHGDAPMLELIDCLNARNVHLTHLSFFLEPGSYKHETYDRLQEAPADEIVLSYGLETGSPKVARNLGRFHDYDLIRDELAYVAAKPYVSSTWWMIGLPEEGPEDVELTKKMLADTMRMGVHARWVTPLILFPQTELALDAERFKIRPLLRTFDDFRRFSTTPANEYAVYPDLITHESDFQSAKDTLRYVVGLKTTIEENLPALEAANHGKREFTTFARYRKGSFF